MYECGTLKPVKGILRRRKGKGENNRGDEPHWVHWTHIRKCHNEPPVQLLCTNKNVFFKKRKSLSSFPIFTDYLPFLSLKCIFFMGLSVW
jgi:hypothetical protein